MKDFQYLFFLLVIFTLPACQENEPQKGPGKFGLIADETFLPILQSESKVYSVHNKDVIPVIHPVPGEEGFRQFLKDTAEAIVASRALMQDELHLLAKKKIYPQQYKIASDAIVFIGSRQRKDSILAPAQISDILGAKVKDWKELGEEAGEIQLVFSNSQSADLVFLLDSLKIQSRAKIFTAGSVEKVVEYVSTHPDAIGVIGLSWISDDPQTNPWLKQIKAFWIKDAGGRLNHPYQENLVRSAYPFKRDIFYIAKFKSGLGINFVSFILSDAGQRLVLKFGLLPAEMPGREVNMQY